ncbi:DUF6274 family protein [Streptomyces sp. t39]|uniref:DUF6274 family protein n=1 Tax=Streptomyces sp. t39 TaxID=1828156 RepID=UPI0011CD8F27|nr:DUF6274 family protein [Streptomyces sp. t39]TXS57758.1 hypothetical protein EAO77_06565 [Streptomyces sp. t39]
MTATAGQHETRALLRAHLAAATGYRHITRTCPVCHRLLRLAMERPDPPADPSDPPQASQASQASERTRSEGDQRPPEE